MSLTATSLMADHAISPRFVFDNNGAAGDQVAANSHLYGVGCRSDGSPLQPTPGNPFHGLVASNGHLGSFEIFDGTTWHQQTSDWLHGTPPPPSSPSAGASPGLYVKILVLTAAEHAAHAGHGSTRLSAHDLWNLFRDSPVTPWSVDSSTARTFPDAQPTHAFHAFRSPVFQRGSIALSEGWVIYGRFGNQTQIWKGTIGHDGRIARLQLFQGDSQPLQTQTTPLVPGGDAQVCVQLRASAFAGANDPNCGQSDATTMLETATDVEWNADVVELEAAGMPYPEYRPSPQGFPHLNEAFQHLYGPTGLVTHSDMPPSVTAAHRQMALAGLARDYFDSRWNGSAPELFDPPAGREVAWQVDESGTVLHRDDHLLQLDEGGQSTNGLIMRRRSPGAQVDHGARPDYEQAEATIKDWNDNLTSAASALSTTIGGDDFAQDLSRFIRTGTSAAGWSARFVGEILTSLRAYLADQDVVDTRTREVVGEVHGPLSPVHDALAAMQGQFTALRQQLEADDSTRHAAAASATEHEHEAHEGPEHEAPEHESPTAELAEAFAETLSGLIEIQCNKRILALRQHIRASPGLSTSPSSAPASSAPASSAPASSAPASSGSTSGGSDISRENEEELNEFIDQVLGTNAEGILTEESVGTFVRSASGTELTVTVTGGGAGERPLVFRKLNPTRLATIERRLDAVEEVRAAAATGEARELSARDRVTAAFESVSWALSAWNVVSSIEEISSGSQLPSIESLQHRANEAQTFLGAAQNIVNIASRVRIANQAESLGRSLTAAERTQLDAGLTRFGAENLGNFFGAVASIAALGSCYCEWRLDTNNRQRWSTAATALVAAAQLVPAIAALAGIECAFAATLNVAGVVLGLGIIVVCWAYSWYRDEHYGQTMEALEAFKRKLVLCSPYVDAPLQKLCLTSVEFSLSSSGGGTLRATTPAALPSYEFAAGLQNANAVRVSCILRLPRAFAATDSPCDGRYARENPEIIRCPRVPLAQGSTPAPGNEFHFEMELHRSDGEVGTYSCEFHPLPWTMLAYEEVDGGLYRFPDGTVRMPHEQFQSVNEILTAPENLGKAIPVVFEVFIVPNGGNVGPLATGRDATGADASCGISDVIFLKRNSATVGSDMRFVDHTTAQAAGIVPVATHEEQGTPTDAEEQTQIMGAGGL